MTARRLGNSQNKRYKYPMYRKQNKNIQADLPLVIFCLFCGLCTTAADSNTTDIQDPSSFFNRDRNEGKSKSIINNFRVVTVVALG